MPNYNKRNYYKVLGVSCDADSETLKKAYRSLAKEYHPDRQPENALAEERFKELQEAYTVLKDPEKRDHYDDVLLRQGPRRNGRPFNAGPGTSKDRTSEASKGTENIFEFIKNRMENRGKRGEDFRYVVTLTFEQAALGIKKVIRIPRRKSCPACNGRGWGTFGQSPVCSGCRGEGEVTILAGTVREVRECAECGGKGLSERVDCQRCKGKGYLPYRVQRTVSIPAGVDNGTRLKIREEGGKGEKGGGNGDLYIVIQIKDHPVFTRSNLDIYCDIPIHFTQAVLGAEIKVPTLKGELPLVIPPGTQSGEVFTLKDCGISGINGSCTGDQKVRVHVEVPRKVSKKEKEILKAWEKICHG